MTSYLRYKAQMTVLDDDNDIESWITVRGNHIPIKKGQSKEEAVKSFIEHQAGKNDLPQGTKWSPTNTKGEGTGNKPSQKKEKYNIQHGAKISDIESMINAHADKKAYKSWKEEEEHVAEKLKEEGIYAYGSQIKEAMKNVYGDVYTKERKEETKKPETSKKWNGTWKTVKVSGLKNTTYTDPDGLNFAVWESSNDPGWKASNRSTEQFNSEEEAFNAASETLKEHKAKYGDFTNKRNKDFMYKVYKKNFPEQEPEMGKGHSAKMRELFSKHYDTLYKHAEKDVQYGDLVKEFDKKLQSDPEFKKEVQSFVKERGDVLSSDREVKAYMLARNEANKTSASKTESKESKESKQPADIMDWKFEDVMKLPVSDPRVHKYIAKNNWLKTSTVSTIAEAFGSTEDLYWEIDRVSNAKGYGWDKIKWGKK